MYAILGENQSDAECIKVLLKRILDTPNLSTKIKGFDGCGDLLKKGARQIGLFSRMGCSRFLIAIDADDYSPNSSLLRAQQIAQAAGVPDQSVIAVPVHEIESWIMSDPDAIRSVIRQLTIPNVQNPEQTENPKEWLINQSRSKRSRPLYNPVTNNAPICQYLQIPVLLQKCTSFKLFHDTVIHKWG